LFVSARRREMPRVPRQESLQALQRVDSEEADEVEREHCAGVALPGHVLVRTDAAHAIDDPLERPEQAVQTERLVLVDPAHVTPEGPRESRQHHEIERELEVAVEGHQGPPPPITKTPPP